MLTHASGVSSHVCVDARVACLNTHAHLRAVFRVSAQKRVFLHSDLHYWCSVVPHAFFPFPHMCANTPLFVSTHRIHVPDVLRRCFNGNRNEDEEIDVRVAAVEQAREDEEARQRVAAAAREQQKQQQIAAQAQEEAAAKEKLLSGELRSLQQRTALVKVLRTIQAGGREPRAAAAAGHFRRAEVDHQHLAGVGEMGFPVVAAMCGACARRGQEEGEAKYAAKCARNAVFDILEM